VAQLSTLGHLRFMAWLDFLYNLSLLITVGADILVLCYVVPAFRRSKNRAFLFIAIACVVGIIDTICDHAVDARSLSESGYIVFRTFLRCGYFTDITFWALGIVSLTRTVLAGSQPTKSDDEVPKVVVSHWKCSKCGEELESQFTSCWKCRTPKQNEPVA